MTVLSELSRKTLSNYVKKAAKEAVSRTGIGSHGGSVTNHHFKKADKRMAGHDKAVDKLAKEGVEPETGEMLTELSRKTLGSYVKKAAKEAVSRTGIGSHGGSVTNHHFKKADKRMAGHDKAVDKLAKEELEAPSEETVVEAEANEYAFSGLDLVMAAASETPLEFEQAFDAIMLERIAEIVDAATEEVAAKMFGEEEDIVDPDPEDETDGEVEVDELSRKTLGSYVKKAAKEAVSRTGIGSHGGSVTNHHFKKADKRMAGHDKAVDKLAKEELEAPSEETLTELSKKTLGSYVKKATLGAVGKAFVRGHDTAKGENTSSDTRRRLSNRMTGVQKAVDKIVAKKG